jgi:hypothetical protein
MATFTYQLSYWLWVKLEKDETKATRQGTLSSPCYVSLFRKSDQLILAEISALEAKLQEAVASTKRP